MIPWSPPRSMLCGCVLPMPFPPMAMVTTKQSARPRESRAKRVSTSNLGVRGWEGCGGPLPLDLGNYTLTLPLSSLSLNQNSPVSSVCLCGIRFYTISRWLCLPGNLTRGWYLGVTWGKARAFLVITMEWGDGYQIHEQRPGALRALQYVEKSYKIKTPPPKFL